MSSDLRTVGVGNFAFTNEPQRSVRILDTLVSMKTVIHVDYYDSQILIVHVSFLE